MFSWTEWESIAKLQSGHTVDLARLGSIISWMQICAAVAIWSCTAWASRPKSSSIIPKHLPLKNWGTLMLYQESTAWQLYFTQRVSTHPVLATEKNRIYNCLVTTWQQLWGTEMLADGGREGWNLCSHWSHYTMKQTRPVILAERLHRKQQTPPHLSTSPPP